LVSFQGLFSCLKKALLRLCVSRSLFEV